MRINKKLFLTISLMLLLGVLFAGCSDKTKKDPEKGSEEVIEMNVNSIYPSTHHMSVNAYDPWVKLVEEKSNGRIKVNLYYGGTLGGTTSVWQDIQGGIYDVGGPAVVPYSFDTELFPLTISGLPFSLPDVQSGANVMTKFAEKYGTEANEKAILMGMAPSLPYDLLSVKPIKKIEDLKGLKIRVTGRSDSGVVKAWGGIPVSIPFEEIYGALEKKTVDAALMTATGMVQNSYHEVAPNLVVINEGLQLMVPVMNRDFYDKLPDDLKELFDTELNLKLAELMNESFIKGSTKDFEKAKELIKDKGEITTLSEEELQKFKKPAQEEWENWVEDANKKGYPGEEMLDYFKQLLQEEGLPLPY